MKNKAKLKSNDENLKIKNLKMKSRDKKSKDVFIY